MGAWDREHAESPTWREGASDASFSPTHTRVLHHLHSPGFCFPPLMLIPHLRCCRTPWQAMNTANGFSKDVAAAANKVAGVFHAAVPYSAMGAVTYGVRGLL